MPIYTVECRGCKIEAERIVPMSERNNQKCLVCEQPMSRCVDLIAKTAIAWEAGWKHGLKSEATYDVGLGTTVYSENHRDRLLKDKGWVRESDLGTDTWDRHCSAIKEDNAKRDKKAADYKDNLEKFNGDKAKAVTETWNAKECLNGEFD